MFLSLSHRGPPPTVVLTAAAFAAGVIATATLGPLVGRSQYAAPAPARIAGTFADRSPASGVAYPAEVLRVLDGDTFEARVRIWPGMDVTTRIRLRGIDAPEMHARCPAERAKAEAARDALTALLAQGNVGITHVGLDKYAGRVDADVSTRITTSISENLYAAGHARRYAGGHREGWCPSRSS